MAAARAVWRTTEKRDGRGGHEREPPWPGCLTGTVEPWPDSLHGGSWGMLDVVS